MYYGADPVCFESVSAVTATPSVQLGARRFYQGEVYEYVYSTGQASVGYGVAYSGTSGHTVTATGVVSGEHCAGFVKHATLTTGTYGWVMKCGVVDAVNGAANSSAADGDLVYLATDGKVRTGKGAPATSATDFVGGFVCGKVLSAGASAGAHLILASMF